MKRQRKEQPDILTSFVTLLLKGVWSLVLLPFRGMRSQRKLNQETYRNHWQVIVGLVSHHDDEQHWTQAVLEADKLVDQALRDLGLAGATFADRLRAAESRFAQDTYQGVWEAHKLRNTIAHEVGYRANRYLAQTALGQFEQGLKALGAL